MSYQKLPILLVKNEGVTCRIDLFSEFRTPEVAREARALGLARASSGTRMPEISEFSEGKITACPIEFRAVSGFSEPDPKIRKPEWAALIKDFQSKLLFLMINSSFIFRDIGISVLCQSSLGTFLVLNSSSLLVRGIEHVHEYQLVKENKIGWYIKVKFKNCNQRGQF
jgi:hypothetical protein